MTTNRTYPEDWGSVTQRDIDDSYVVTYNGLPYHVPTAKSFMINEGYDEEKATAIYNAEWKDFWENVNTWALANPDKVTHEPVPEPPTPPTLDEVKASKNAELAKARYNEINKTGMSYTHYDDDNPDGLAVTVDTDSNAQTSITGQCVAAQTALNAGTEDTTTAILWKFRNQVWGYFSYAGFIQFSALVCDWIEKRYAKEKVLVGRVNACTTVEEVEAISWEDTEPNEEELEAALN